LGSITSRRASPLRRSRCWRNPVTRACGYVVNDKPKLRQKSTGRSCGAGLSHAPFELVERRLDNLLERHGRPGGGSTLVVIGTERVTKHTGRVRPILQLDRRTVEQVPQRERGRALCTGENRGRFHLSEFDERELGAIQRAREHRSVARSEVVS
jgi:hypothetical protein